MKSRKITCLLLVFAMLLSLAGCGTAAGKAPAEGSGIPQPMEEYEKGHALEDGKQRVPEDPRQKVDGGDLGSAKPAGGMDKPSDGLAEPAGKTEKPSATDVSPVAFEDAFQAYLQNGAMAGESYMASPASFRAALCLLIEGAGGETLDGLLQASWFDSVDAARGWYSGLLERQSVFREHAASMERLAGEYGMGSPGLAFDIANGIWDNSDVPGSFTDEYKKAVSDVYHAAAGTSPSDRITDDVNAWCDETTHGMIDKISDDLSRSASVLANSLYVKSAWLDGFFGNLTETGMFAKADGTEVEMDFMRQVQDYYYFEAPNGRRYASIGLEGGIWLTVCLDPDARVQDMYLAQHSMESALLDVLMPKLDLETTLGKGELAGYLKDAGAGLAFTEQADFSAMCADVPWDVDDVIQKTRLKTDEDGLEAASVTAIMMETSCALPAEPETPVEFYMDGPFAFLITSGMNHANWEEGCEILFFGRFEG